MEAKKCRKNAENHECKKCNFICSKKSNYSKHLLTAKHQMEAFSKKRKQENATPSCEFCKKKYKSRGSLWKHQQICSFIPPLVDYSTPANTETIKQREYPEHSIMDISLVSQLMQENTEIKRLLIEQNKQIIELASNAHTITNISNTTHNNQKFNLNFFLNTTCKDAMNMSEFIENIVVDFKDIEDIGKNGYVSGMTNMILSRIKDLDITKRPLHCTDLKREIMYIKDNDEWCKDTPENTKLRNMITIVGKQNYNVVPLWRKQHPNCNLSDHPNYNFCMDMMRNIIGDVGIEQARLDSKVIKNISKQILIDK
jgi:hypothetical protein